MRVRWGKEKQKLRRYAVREPDALNIRPKSQRVNPRKRVSGKKVNAIGRLNGARGLLTIAQREA